MERCAGGLAPGTDTKVRYVSFYCADGYYERIDMASPLHPQAILALDFRGKSLTPPFGFPLRLRIPTKLGFKSPKSLIDLGVTNVFPGGYWGRRATTGTAGPEHRRTLLSGQSPARPARETARIRSRVVNR